MLTHSVQPGYKATLQLAARVPLHMCGSIPYQGGGWQFIPPPDMKGYLPISPPTMFGLANCDPVQWVVVSIFGFTIWWGLWAETSFPWPNVCVPSNIYSNISLPGVFTHLQWMLWQTSMVEVVTWHYSTPGKSCWQDIRWPHYHYFLVASSYLHFHWKWACMGWGWYTCPMHDGCLYARECQPLMPWEEVGFGRGHMTFHVGLSLCKRECLLWSDALPYMFPLPTYPWSSSSLKSICLH